MKNAQVILAYSDVFPGEKPNLIEKIKNANMHKTISIISELIQIRDAKCKSINIFGMVLELPFEIILKRDYCGMRPKSPEEMMESTLLEKNKHIISLQMLLILLKKVIIYGNYNSLSQQDYKITDEDYKEVIMMQLLVADEISEKHREHLDADHYLYSTYHLNYRRNVANEFLRMYYMMECLSRNPHVFSNDIQAEYRDYYRDFTEKYCITPTEYSSLLFLELNYYYSEKNCLSALKCWRNVELTYMNAKEKEKISKVIDILKINPIKLREWAINSEMEEWDFTSFYSFPFISDGQSNYISISDVTLINAFFEKIFWLIRDCYPQEDSRAMAFFGRLFERYIQDATKDACHKSYTYIDEFQFQVNGNNRKSSDAYVRRENNLLVVEAKGFSVLVDCMAKNEKIEKNNEKLFVTPVLQADERLNEFYEGKVEFAGVKEAFVISVTLDNINAVPNYYNAIHKEISDKKKCPLVQYYFNFSIEEYEMLLYLIEQNLDIFKILRDYFASRLLSPFSNYVKEKVEGIKRTKFMEKNYKDAKYKMESML